MRRALSFRLVRGGLAITRLAAAGLLAAACAGAKPAPVRLIRPDAAVKHARGDQTDIAAREGAPDVVKFYSASSVTQWMYCGDESSWARVIDFDGNGNVLISVDLPGEEGSVCAKKLVPTPPSRPQP
jgi:hypothetical protein